MKLDKVLMAVASVAVGLGVVGAVVGTMIAPDEPGAVASAEGAATGSGEKSPQEEPSGDDPPEVAGGVPEGEDDGAGEGEDEGAEDGAGEAKAPAPADLEPLTLPQALEGVKADPVMAFLTRLSSDETQGRKTGSPGAKAAREMIVEELRAGGVPPAEGGYERPFSRGEVEGVNVAAFIEGGDPALKEEVVILGAHYDHKGVAGKRKGDLVFNGADNNGSGTTAVLFAARALARVPLKRSVLILFFSGGEQEMAGSWAYVEEPLGPLEKVGAMVNLDSIGHADRTPAKLFGVSEPHLKELAKDIIGEHRDLPVRALTGLGRLRKSSDSYPFYKKKVQTLTLHGGRQRNEGRVGDHVEDIDPERMVGLTRYTILLVEGLANLEE